MWIRPLAFVVPIHQSYFRAPEEQTKQYDTDNRQSEKTVYFDFRTHIHFCVAALYTVNSTLWLYTYLPPSSYHTIHDLILYSDVESVINTTFTIIVAMSLVMSILPVER